MVKLKIPFSANLKSILINHLFGDKETEVKSIKEFIRGFIMKMKEVQEVAEKARAIGLSVGLGLSPKPSTIQGKSPKKIHSEEEEKKKPHFKRCWRCGSDVHWSRSQTDSSIFT